MTYEGALPDTLLVNGHDVQGFDLVTVVDLSGLFAPGTRRGSAEVIPRQQGQLGARLAYDAYAFSVPIVIGHQTRADMINQLRLMGDWFGSADGLCTLARRLSKTGGGYDTHTARGQWVGFNSFSLLNAVTGQTELQFINLSGAWWNGSRWLVP